MALRHKFLSMMGLGGPLNNNGESPRNGSLRDSLVPIATAFASQEPREVDPHFYELLRESFPTINTAINKMITLDGVVSVECETDNQQRLLDEWMESVRVNDLLTGFQSWVDLLGNETYEQGCSVSDYRLENRLGVTNLRVADSKGLVFMRDPDNGHLRGFYRPPRAPQYGNDQKPIERVLRNQAQPNVSSLTSNYHYVELDLSQILYTAHHPEADNPYGVSLLRAMTADAEVLAHIKAAVKQTWQRFGDPSYEVIFKSGIKRDETQLANIEKEIAQNLANLVNAKKLGKGGDLVRSIGNKDELTTNILGAGGSEMDVEKPSNFVISQMVSATGLPAWMVGVEKPAQDAAREAEMALHESQQRFESRKATYKKPLLAHLRGSGETFKPGDIQVTQKLPNLTNVVANAQAEFLQAQADMMRANGAATRAGTPGAPPAQDNIDIEEDEQGGKHMVLRFPLEVGHKAKKSEAGVWAETDSRLPALEQQAESAAVSAWRNAGDRIIATTGLTQTTKTQKSGEPLFEFNPQWLLDFDRIVEQLIADLGEGEGSAVAGAAATGAMLGTQLAATELNVDPAKRARERAQQAALSQGLVNARKTATRVLRDELLKPLSEGAYNGENVFDVARRLRRHFDNGETDFALLARTEIAQALVVGKEQQYQEEGLIFYDYLNADDSKVSAICRLHQSNNPHRVGQGPLPARDSHPDCRCTIAPSDDQPEFTP